MRRFSKLLIGLAVLGLLALPRAGQGAEKLGAYVHGERRADDGDVYACVHEEIAIEMARKINVIPPFSKTKEEDERNGDKVVRILESTQHDCMTFNELDHTSLRTLYDGSEFSTDWNKFKVVETRVFFEGDTTIAYIVTYQDVPPAQ